MKENLELHIKDRPKYYDLPPDSLTDSTCPFRFWRPPYTPAPVETLLRQATTPQDASDLTTYAHSLGFAVETRAKQGKNLKNKHKALEGMVHFVPRTDSTLKIKHNEKRMTTTGCVINNTAYVGIAPRLRKTIRHEKEHLHTEIVREKNSDLREYLDNSNKKSTEALIRELISYVAQGWSNSIETQASFHAEYYAAPEKEAAVFARIAKKVNTKIKGLGLSTQKFLSTTLSDARIRTLQDFERVFNAAIRRKNLRLVNPHFQPPANNQLEASA